MEYDTIWLRLGFFVSVLLLCTLWENYLRRKPLTVNRSYRWLNNLTLVALNSAIIAVVMPIAAFQAAILVHENQWGLLNLLSLPTWLNILFSVLLLDLIIYLQHLVFHKTKLLWKIHRVHHADLDIDVTTGIRFHPLEIVISMGVKIAAIFILGVSPVAIVVFEIVLNASAMFNHSNAKLALPLDSKLRKIFVTPDVHRVHHSITVKETHSNFGFFLSIWDRFFGTYRSQPELGHDGVVIGVPEIRDQREQRLDKMMTQPFRY
ncbi:sterol desaturase family protein [Vibrio sp. Vb2110]|uniref:sterol desaturase family protein n=1 Tax=Vibrio TaxID=662 RepID=UPI0005431F75|nr:MULTISPECIES: sterol desaturase family protein [Vibrio]EHR5764867.1 sterol desaturase family protein [Vibrio parahaemolyticus]EHY0932752.1 sterol desaturase family protein [Vibrio parahaemolyticus]EIZ0312371.1 sterol desaturase family protein [Vibrio parahaemolyticus]EJE8515941.1 sterol desaturase family protein [Vibrio parahaemolyticus]EJE8774737.1 sterol desaturase family protein [Vibrio parahaemolyticus]